MHIKFVVVFKVNEKWVNTMTACMRDTHLRKRESPRCCKNTSDPRVRGDPNPDDGGGVLYL